MSRRGLLLALLLAAAQRPAGAQTPVLVRDIETRHPGTSLTFHAEMAGVVYFSARTDAAGVELWRSDGSAAGTWLVKDICPGNCDSVVGEGVALGGALLLAVREDLSLYLWRSDGTEAGTQPVSRTAFDTIGRFTTLGGFAYFLGSSRRSPGLFRSDGTDAGTSRVADLEGSGQRLWAAGGRLFFLGHQAATGSELWTSDGTAAGTHLVRDIQPGALSGLFSLRNTSASAFIELGGVILFEGCDPLGGCELWRSDGTAGGTWQVIDLGPGTNEGLGPFRARRFVRVGGEVYFVNGSSDTLWKTDGTAAGTVEIKHGTTSFQYPSVVSEAGGRVFVVESLVSRWALWSSDGTPAGSFRLDPVESIDYLFQGYVSVAGELWFSGFSPSTGNDLWRSDGSPGGTRLILDAFSSRTGGWATKLFATGSRLFFEGVAATGESQLWTSDGTPAGTHVLRELNDGRTLSSTPGFVARVPGGILLTAGESISTRQPWFSDGTSAGTHQVAGVCTDLACLQSPVALETAAVFVLTSGGREELWRSDGTEAGTFALGSACPGSCALAIASGAASGGQVYFQPSAGSLWRSDGSPGGTFEVAPVAVDGYRPPLGADLDGVWLFSGNDGGGTKLWRSRGSLFSTWPVADLCPVGCAPEPGNFVSLGNRVYFTAMDDLRDRELWVSDGTPGGTRLVAALCPGACSSEPSAPLAVGDSLFFLARPQAGSPPALWRTDRAGATARLLPVGPGPSPTIDPNASSLTAAGARLYFTAWSSDAGAELWVSDGTPAGTRMVADIVPGPAGSAPRDLAAAGGSVWFVATEPATGSELWTSDGTSSGTRRVADLRPGPLSSDTSWLVRDGTRLYFNADDGVTGLELWALDLPSPGALLRNADLRRLDPPQPALSSLLPLDPARHRYLAVAFEGDVEPDPSVLRDAARPLVFYALDRPGLLRLVKTPVGSIALAF